jgi:hypothetical protein
MGLETVRKGAEMVYSEVARSWQGRSWELAGKGVRTGRKGSLKAILQELEGRGAGDWEGCFVAGWCD